MGWVWEIWGSNLGSETIDLCGGVDNKIPISEVTKQLLAANGKIGVPLQVLAAVVEIRHFEWRCKHGEFSEFVFSTGKAEAALPRQLGVLSREQKTPLSRTLIHKSFNFVQSFANNSFFFIFLLLLSTPMTNCS